MEEEKKLLSSDVFLFLSFDSHCPYFQGISDQSIHQPMDVPVLLQKNPGVL
jgi:hypothetical protein